MNNQPDYYSNDRSDVQSLVKNNSKVILDVGCGAGVMADALKKKFDAEVWGIELVESEAQKAREKLDNVFSGAIEDNISKLPNQYFDSIIFADVLEHLIDPYTILKQLVLNLQDDGEIVASIPNIGYWGVIYSLLVGQFTYTDSGILDKTHLRFFTKTSIIEMFDNAGLTIIEMLPTKGNFPPIPDKFLETCKEMGIDAEKLKVESSSFQYLIKAIKKELYQSVFDEVNKANILLENNKYTEALEKFKNLRENFRKYNKTELHNLSIYKIDEIIEKLEKI